MCCLEKTNIVFGRFKVLRGYIAWHHLFLIDGGMPLHHMVVTIKRHIDLVFH